MVENAEEIVRYFADERETDAVIAELAAEDVRSLAGAWADLDWEEAVEEFDRIRVVEYLMGRSRFGDRRTQLRQLPREITPMFLRYSVFDWHAWLHRQLRPSQGPELIADVDAFIAATELERDLTIVKTGGDYSRVLGLSAPLLDRQTLVAVNSPTA